MKKRLIALLMSCSLVISFSSIAAAEPNLYVDIQHETAPYDYIQGTAGAKCTAQNLKECRLEAKFYVGVSEAEGGTLSTGTIDTWIVWTSSEYYDIWHQYRQFGQVTEILTDGSLSGYYDYYYWP